MMKHTLLVSMKLTSAFYYSTFSRGLLRDLGLNKFLGPERGAYWRRGLIEREPKREL